MPEVERVGVEQFSQNFGRLHDSRSGVVEVLVAVGDEHAPGAPGGQLRPLRVGRQDWHLVHRPGNVERVE